MLLIDNIPVFGPPDDRAVQQIRNCLPRADKVALMADHHVGYAVPIGGVVAYKDAISPSGVGYDIGCGNKAVLIDTPSDHVRENIQAYMDQVFSTVSFGIGRVNGERVDHDLFDSPLWSNPVAAPLKELARSQLGTVGSGNHYVDIFVDELERIWIGCHFGSRGLGHKIASAYLKLAGGKDGMFVDPVVLDASSDLGTQYIEAMNLAGEYAYAGRDWVCDRVAKLLGGSVIESVHNHHNFAWREGDYWVIRKGATPAFPGQRGFVGGSMGDNSVIIEGTGIDSELTLNSTIHGAGRVMGRREAIKGRVTQEMHNTWMEPLGVAVRGSGIDESPHCYKRLSEVLVAQGPSIKVIHTLKPLGVAMAGADVRDPYKD